MAHMEGTINLEMMFLKNGYRLGDRLGKGSFAVVKKAVHLPTGRDLAVKIVDHNLATKEFLEKFLSREMNIIGGLKHPNIIDVEKVLLICWSTQTWDGFTTRRVCTALTIMWLMYVGLSLCPPITRQHYAKTAKHIIKHLLFSSF